MNGWSSKNFLHRVSMIFRMTANTTCNDYAGYDSEMLMCASLIDHSAVFEPTLTKNGSLDKDKCFMFTNLRNLVQLHWKLSPLTHPPMHSSHFFMASKFPLIISILFVSFVPALFAYISSYHTLGAIFLLSVAIVGCIVCLSKSTQRWMFLCTSIYSD